MNKSFVNNFTSNPKSVIRSMVFIFLSIFSPGTVTFRESNLILSSNVTFHSIVYV